MGETCIIKPWGNSCGVIIPKEFMEEKGLKIGDEVNVSAFKKLDLSKLEKLDLKMSGQEFKDMVREGWD